MAFLWSKGTKLLPQGTGIPGPSFVPGSSAGGNSSLMTGIDANILAEILEIRNLFPSVGRPAGSPGTGLHPNAKLPHRLRELYNAESIPKQWYEPDPRTFRSRFYYNSRLNKVYMKIATPVRSFWKQINL